ncbi:hypothetical protein [Bifidobacterium miconisargentati]|uniref:hypothetical protein n=1 Tax=Bifidobacterium miconisargentati TaxID=2834437 RepID=UPI001BDC5398|nr:hypothetical protein [Bifidobacterium miconisargentati]MBW3090406.1 hypothetical protein [Bifidobacterium miconisargentati]
MMRVALSDCLFEVSGRSQWAAGAAARHVLAAQCLPPIHPTSTVNASRMIAMMVM